MNEFSQLVHDHSLAANSALEAVAANAAIGAFKYEGAKFEMDEEFTSGLTDEEKKLVERFTNPTENGVPEVVVHQATEGFLDTIGVMNIQNVIGLINNSIHLIEKNVTAYKTLLTRMQKTLVASNAKIGRLYDRSDVGISVDFGAYSRFFHIGNKATTTDLQFIEGLFVHRAASEWCALHSPEVLKEVAALVSEVFPTIERDMPNISEALVAEAIQKVGEIFDKHYSKDSLVGLGSSGYSVSSVRIPKIAQQAKDITSEVKGAMFDGNVVLYHQPKKRSLDNVAYACTIVRDDQISRTEVKGFDIEKGKELKAIITQGVQIVSNTWTSVSVLEKYIGDYLKPMKEAINFMVKNKMLVSGTDIKLLTHYAALARLLNDSTFYPLLNSIWVDARLCRVIAGMAEAYFVRNPKDRTIFAKDIQAV